MADIDLSPQNKPIQGGTWGNCSIEWFHMVPEANWAIASAILVTELQEGTILFPHLFRMTIEDNLASGTLSVGYRYKDPALTANDNLTFFSNVQTTAAAGSFGVQAANVNKPVRLLGDAYLVVTVAGAAYPTTNALDLVLQYDFAGHK